MVRVVAALRAAGVGAGELLMAGGRAAASGHQLARHEMLHASLLLVRLSLRLVRRRWAALCLRVSRGVVQEKRRLRDKHPLFFLLSW